ncbi:MAG: glycosyltransferase [Chlamydiota bacterium]
MKMEAPRVTVAIPCHNGERFLARSIESVLAQECPGIEIAVFDDGSDDRSVEIARVVDDPRLTVRQTPARLGIGANWNQGLRHGSGPYVIIHHQDDVMAPGAIEKKAAFMEAHPGAGFVYSRIEAIDEEGKKLPEQWHWFSNDLFDRDRLFESIPFFMALLLGKNLICCPSVMMRRSAALEIGGFNEAMAFTLDWEMWLRMAAAYPVGYVDAVTTYYRCHKRQETQRHVDRQAEHSYDARISALRRSAARVNAWPASEVLAEIVSLVRQIEERSPLPRGLEILAPPVSEPVGAANGNARIRELIGPIRGAFRAAVYPLILFPLAWMMLKAAARHACARARAGKRARGGGEETR